MEWRDSRNISSFFALAILRLRTCWIVRQIQMLSLTGNYRYSMVQGHSATGTSPTPSTLATLSTACQLSLKTRSLEVMSLLTFLLFDVCDNKHNSFERIMDCVCEISCPIRKYRDKRKLNLVL
ncbi:uncharacterized protein LOC143909080 [Arctopsyche grandis]|uniref:uncharacterized protein LOC143909080 n=1 Tax=Arctopsyche grandis TaxID=121162 RepID=UPI00406D8CFD